MALLPLIDRPTSLVKSVDDRAAAETEVKAVLAAKAAVRSLANMVIFGLLRSIS